MKLTCILLQGKCYQVWGLLRYSDGVEVWSCDGTMLSFLPSSRQRNHNTYNLIIIIITEKIDCYLCFEKCAAIRPVSGAEGPTTQVLRRSLARMTPKASL